MIKKYRKPYRVKKKKPIFRNRFFWLGILISVAVVGIFYLICFSAFFQIKEIKISGNQKVPTGDLENIIQNQIVRNLFFSQTKSIFLVNLNIIKLATLEKFPQINQINFKRKFPQSLEVTVEERKPEAIFCQEEKCFFLDKEGIIFEEVSGGEEYPKIKNSAINQPLNFGDRVVEKELLRLILETELKLRDDFKIPIGELLIVSDENVHAKTLEGWEIYFNPKGDLGWQLTKLKADLEEEILQEKRKDLEYIELRFGNFAPYKYRD